MQNHNLISEIEHREAQSNEENEHNMRRKKDEE
jgi:hypothetical protein